MMITATRPANKTQIACYLYEHPDGGDIAFSLGDLPVVGSSTDWGELKWIVETLSTYESTSGSVVMVATCIQPSDDELPQGFSSPPGKQLLYCFMGESGEITAEDFDPEDKNVHVFGITPHFRYLPKPGQTPPSSYGWMVDRVEEFALEGIGGCPSARFDAIYICWCRETAA